MPDTVLNQYTANKLPAETQTDRIGRACTRGGIITNDVQVSEFFKQLHIGGAGATGTMVVLGKDGGYIPYIGLAANTFVDVVGNMVVSSADIGGVTYTTTVTNVTWHGGN